VIVLREREREKAQATSAKANCPGRRQPAQPEERLSKSGATAWPACKRLPARTEEPRAKSPKCGIKWAGKTNQCKYQRGKKFMKSNWALLVGKPICDVEREMQVICVVSPCALFLLQTTTAFRSPRPSARTTHVDCLGKN
jgi:hypothetical protein